MWDAMREITERTNAVSRATETTGARLEQPPRSKELNP